MRCLFCLAATLLVLVPVRAASVAKQPEVMPGPNGLARQLADDPVRGDLAKQPEKISAGNDLAKQLEEVPVRNDYAQQVEESHVKPSLLGKWPNADLAIQSKNDYWGELAMRQPNGPSFDFFAKILPPLRYVDASFRHYPIVLSAPGAAVKARYVSNGSAVNALARQINWIGETGVPIEFLIGEDEQDYGSDLANLDGPHYDKGWLPIVKNTYRHGDALVAQEAFCGVDAPYADNGAVLMRITGRGKFVARISAMMAKILTIKSGNVTDSKGAVLASISDGWGMDVGGQRLFAWLKPDHPLYLVIYTKPPSAPLPEIDSAEYEAQRSKCAQVWESLVADGGMQVETPEPVVNNAWRSLLVGMYEIVNGDKMNYSACNQYGHLYISEGGDAIRALGLWGHQQDMRRMLNPLMDYQRDGLWYNQAGKKLYFMSHYYQLTRDASWFKENRDRWMLQVDRLVNDREPGNGLLPKERYCGDIATPVYSLNVNANGYGSLRDFAAVLEDLGEQETAQKCAKAAAELRKATLDAVIKSECVDVDPVFIPNALFGEEKPYDPLTSVRLGGYWDLMAPYILGSDIFKGTPREDWMIQYLQSKGGVCMGMVRTHPSSSFWTVKQNLDDLYSLRYTLVLLRRDEVDRALVSFYGKLAQGLTRDTFIGAEGTCPLPLDKYGRQMYMPPNSASNAYWLWMLRYLMAQDWDMNTDGRPETLRLMFATPKSWLEDGKAMKIEHAPTAFGEVSVRTHSYLKKGSVVADVTAPPRSPDKTLLRARVPDGWRVISAKSGTRALAVDKTGAVDISALKGRFQVAFRVVRSL